MRRQFPPHRQGNEDSGKLFSDVTSGKGVCRKERGQVAGPFQATFDGNTIVLEDADAEAGDWS
jgi:hypothetical protein